MHPNHRNAQLSTGPKTPEGKLKVSQNRILHCLTGSRVLLPSESPETYALLRGALFDEHNPQGPTETFLVEQLVHNQHRLTRIAEMETAVLAELAGLSVDDPTPATLAALELVRRSGDPVKAHVVLQRYETSIRRAYNQALTQLRVTQNNRTRDAAERREFFDNATEAARGRIYAELAAVPKRPSAQAADNELCDSNPTAPEIDPNDAS